MGKCCDCALPICKVSSISKDSFKSYPVTNKLTRQIICKIVQLKLITTFVRSTNLPWLHKDLARDLQVDYIPAVLVLHYSSCAPEKRTMYGWFNLKKKKNRCTIYIYQYHVKYSLVFGWEEIRAFTDSFSNKIYSTKNFIYNPFYKVRKGHAPSLSHNS